MIIDKIQNWKIYFKAPIFENIFQELTKFSIETPNGVYKNNDDYYFKIMSYDTKLNAEIVESHRKEVDIQILFSGEEHIKIYNAEGVTIKEPYAEETDCQFYIANKKPVSQIDLVPGYMAVFFPDDIHHPQFAVNNRISNLKKVVIKINEKLFS